MTNPTTQKVYENRLRRMADRQGLTLAKSRRRDPRALDFGTFRLLDARTGTPAPDTAEQMTLEDVEAYLTGERKEAR